MKKVKKMYFFKIFYKK